MESMSGLFWLHKDHHSIVKVVITLYIVGVKDDSVGLVELKGFHIVKGRNNSIQMRL